MIKIKEFDAIIFDFGGVLVDLDINRCLKNFEKLGIKNLNSLLNEYTQLGFISDFETGRIDAAGFCNAIRDFAADESIQDESIIAAWESFLVDVPVEKLNMLLSLKEHKKVFMLSNTNPIHIKMAKKKYFGTNGHTIADYFDKCFFSYQIGVAKPDPAIFKYVMENTNIAPGKCLFIDDGKHNIETAKKLGFGTYLVGKNETFKFQLD